MRLNNTATPRGAGRRPGLIVAACIAVAALAGSLTYTYLRSAVPSKAVLVISRDLPANARVQPSDLTVSELPPSAVPADAVTDVAAVNGLLTKGPLLKGDVLRQGYLTEHIGSGLSYGLAQQMPDRVLISLTAEAMEGLQGQVAPGDLLDILGVLQVSNGKTNESRVGQLARSARVVTATAAQKEGLTTQAGTILVAVTPAEAAAVKLAQAAGKVYVQLSTGKSTAPPVMTPETVLGR